ncbi:MAG: FG-GAP-like repeat-containing protein [Chitinophagaceae bacterium]
MTRSLPLKAIRLADKYLFVAAIVFISACHADSTLFKKIQASHSGIAFSNNITENDSINPIDMDFLYNGGGVAAGDFNNDGLPDLYFTASMVSNKLYLNQGHMSFKDVTTAANVDGSGRWCNAASVVDINNDGWQDIYVCTSIKNNPEKRKNLLYVSQGLNKDSTPVFQEMAAEYGLDDTSYSVHAAFFDYDNDGDLDMYLVTTQLAKRASASFSSNKLDESYADIDKIFRNDWNDSLQHPVFIDVSREAGITEHGFGLGVGIADINRDGWKDIYVTNDFYGSDLLYINNKNGTFSNKAKEYFKHSSQNAMGNDIADINNDGLADIIAVDMNPENNYRKKKNMNGNNYFIYQNMLYDDMLLQYVRNTLQLNAGPVTGNNDSVLHPVFSDIGFYTGVAETDWSWSPLIADVNNDGNRDLLITNGYPKDVTDHDFASFRMEAEKKITKQQLIEQIPAIKIPNYGFENKGNLQFDNAADAWGISEPSFSNGAVCIDLDDDGDLDYVINNINEQAFIYENTTRTAKSEAVNYLTIQFFGDSKNRFGIGAWAEIYYDNGKKQVFENSPYRGYLSTSDTKAFFGLGSIAVIDSVHIIWPGNKMQKLKNVRANQLLAVNIVDADREYTWQNGAAGTGAIFTDVTRQMGVDYLHQEMDFIDFDKERLLPHKLSQYGPGLAAGDIDGNGLDDIAIGGSGDNAGKVLLQQPNGKFITKEMPAVTGKDPRKPENLGLLLFDAEGDGDVDLYCASGSNEYGANTKNYQDQLFINNGKGNFSFDTSGVLPVNLTSKSCVKAADLDNDGDLDLFIGGRCLPGQYPLPVNSFIYRNDSKNGKIKFTDVTVAIAPALQNIGMVCDAVWTDFDSDGQLDLILAGEWMPITFLKNNHGKFENRTPQSGLSDQSGWWNSIAAGDFDNDGDIDYIVGNLGQNSFFRASDQYPVNIYAKDFDGNGSQDAIITNFLKNAAGVKKEYTAFNRDDIMNQLPGLKRKFLTYKDFGNADFQQLFTEAQMKGSYKLRVNNFKSVMIKNMGNGKFIMQPLPVAAQLAPLFGMQVGDFNNDGNLDVLITGNDFGNEVTNGRYDAFNGLLMTGDGNGSFAATNALESGIYIPGDGKALIQLKTTGNNYLIVASQNKGPLKIFRNKTPAKQLIGLNKDDQLIFISFKNGATRKEEIYYGSSFLSQSAQFVVVNDKMKKVLVINRRGAKREINL